MKMAVSGKHTCSFVYITYYLQRDIERIQSFVFKQFIDVEDLDCSHQQERPFTHKCKH